MSLGHGGDGGMNSVEVGQMDLRFEGYRLKNAAQEGALLTSISQVGIQEPLRGASTRDGQFILLDGFKRIRCGKKLGMGAFPFLVLGEDEATGILQLLRIANSKSLSILEQAQLVDELKRVHGLSVSEIARSLDRSTGWVSMRLGFLGEIPVKVKEAIFAGRFPAYCYLYTLRQFMRMKQVKPAEVEEFVNLVAGKRLSTRDIDLLARGFFQGGEAIRGLIRAGHFAMSLGELKQDKKPPGAEDGKPSGHSEFEARFLRDLEIAQKYIARISHTVSDPRITSAVHAEAGLLAGGCLRLLPAFGHALQGFYDRVRKT